MGQRVDTTLVQAQTVHDCWNWMTRLMASRFPDAFTAVPRVDEARRFPNGPLSFRLLVALSRDGRWMQFSQTSERLWVAFMESLGLGWMLHDPEWMDAASDASVDKREALWERMLTRPGPARSTSGGRCSEEHPDVFAEVFRRGTELLHHPQVVHDKQVVEMDDPQLGKVRQLGALVKMSETPAVLERPARHRSTATTQRYGREPPCSHAPRRPPPPRMQRIPAPLWRGSPS